MQHHLRLELPVRLGTVLEDDNFDRVPHCAMAFGSDQPLSDHDLRIWVCPCPQNPIDPIACHQFPAKRTISKAIIFGPQPLATGM